MLTTQQTTETPKTTANHPSPQVWVGCLAAYNAGTLHGEWIDATDADEMQEEIARILANSPIDDAEEWFFADNDNFGGLSIEEYDSVEFVARMGALIEKHGEAFAKYVEHIGDDETSEEDFLDHYEGEWESEVAYAEHIFDECWMENVPENIQSYINYAAFSNDLFMDDYFSVAADCGVYVYNR